MLQSERLQHNVRLGSFADIRRVQVEVREGQKENWVSLSPAQRFIVRPVLVATRGRQTKGK